MMNVFYVRWLLDDIFYYIFRIKLFTTYVVCEVIRGKALREKGATLHSHDCLHAIVGVLYRVLPLAPA